MARKHPFFGGEHRAALCFLAPSLLGLFGMYLVPTLDVVKRSFYSAMGDGFVGLQNYRAVLTNSSFLLAVGNTARFLVICVPLLLVISLFVSLLLEKTPVVRDILKTTYLLPLVVPVTSVVMIARLVFHKNGLLTALCTLFGSAGADWLNSPWAFYVLVLCYLWKNLGYHVVLWLAGLAAIPVSVYEAAAIDGANALERFFHITLPLLKQTAILSLALALINSFKVFREAYLLAGSYPHSSIYMLQHVLSNWFTNLDMQKISAAATLLMAFVLLLLFFFQRRGSEQ